MNRSRRYEIGFYYPFMALSNRPNKLTVSEVIAALEDTIANLRQLPKSQDASLNTSVDIFEVYDRDTKEHL